MTHTSTMKILLNNVRYEKNLTLEALAALSDVSKSTLHNIETRKTSPTVDQLEKIAKALNCRITDLFESDYK